MDVKLERNKESKKESPNLFQRMGNRYLLVYTQLVTRN